MYTCTQCKIHYNEEPYRKQGANHSMLLCMKCAQSNDAKASIGTRQYNERLANRNKCLWCDDELSDKNRSKGTGTKHSNMCVKCDATSPFRTLLEKWASAIGPDSDKENRFWAHINDKDRRAKWQNHRSLAISKEQESKAPKQIDRHNWSEKDLLEFDEYLRWKRMKEQK